MECPLKSDRFEKIIEKIVVIRYPKNLLIEINFSFELNKRFGIHVHGIEAGYKTKLILQILLSNPKNKTESFTKSNISKIILFLS